MKLRGVISLRKLFPIWAIPNGIFTLDELLLMIVPGATGVILAFLLAKKVCIFYGVFIGVVSCFSWMGFKRWIGHDKGLIPQLYHKYLNSINKKGVPDSSINEFLT